VEAGFDSDIGGDVPDWDNTESRESDEDAAWRDLVARFDAPVIKTEPIPWPERENVLPPAQGTDPAADANGDPDARGTDPVRRPEDVRGTDGAEVSHEAYGYGDVTGTDGLTETRTRHVPDGGPDEAGDQADHGAADQADHGAADRADHGAADRAAPDGTTAGVTDDLGVAGGAPRGGAASGTAGLRGTAGVRGFDDEGVRGALDPDGRHGTLEPDVIQAARRRRRTEARSIRARQALPVTPADDDDEHFVPPPPPPLPQLDSLAKGAWAALFGGPAYLVVATAAGWSVPGIAAFFAVAAFVTGFAILVLRMNEPGPGGPDDGDDGAVV
jgi:hypothetical protein